MLKKMNWMIALLAAGLIIFSVSCSKDEDDENDGSAVSDEQALQELITADSDIEGLNPWEGDDSGIRGAGGLDESISPNRWGRIGQRALVSVNVTVEGDSFATITRTSSFNGEFRISSLNEDSSSTIYNKPMYNTIVRKAHARRVARSRFPRQNWRITEVTPEVLTSTTPNPNTLWPTRVLVISGTDTIADVSDPLNTYFNRDNLPTANTETELTMFVTANTTSPAIAILHPRVFRVAPHPRLMLFDDGTGEDETAGDGIYSGAYTTGVRTGVHFAGFDLLDYETLFDSESAYDAGGWAVPYRIVE